MASQGVERRLSAVLAADVAGYSRLMGADEEGTLARLTAHRRELFDPTIAKHRGRIVKTTGDGLLATFASVVDAVKCAAEVQTGMAERNAAASGPRIDFRIGINVGDIVEQDDDIFGDGVNIAARLESIAIPGGICVSARVQEDAAGRVDVAFEDMGEQNLKNIARPVRAFHVRLKSDGAPAPASRTATPPPADQKPALAVLPFQNMSGDPEQEYFSDGIVEDIITALSRFRSFAVIARNSSFVYKGKAVDVRQVARDLGVQYVLEGSVRRVGGRLRVTAQLIDAASGAHLWADKFDGSVEDVFDVQDTITASVATIVEPRIHDAEVARSHRERPGSLTAYDFYLQALPRLRFGTQPENAAAFELVKKALALDPDNAVILSLGVEILQHRFVTGWPALTDDDKDACNRMVRHALANARDNATVLARCGNTLVQMMRDYEVGLATVERAVTLNPNDAEAVIIAGVCNTQCGSVDRALAYFDRVFRLNPQDPQVFIVLTGTAHALMVKGDFLGALERAETSVGINANYDPTYWMLIAADAQLGRMDEARRWLARFRSLVPDVTLGGIRAGQADKDGTRLRAILEGLRMAGLPES
ncbi:MAG TPA: adenylate/guanylate cyclase domain-containing protein [Bauldia sp.]|nr:adenylate/guanylate cyclase domain-containing protein [Bauldia sp.]